MNVNSSIINDISVLDIHNVVCSFHSEITDVNRYSAYNVILGCGMLSHEDSIVHYEELHPDGEFAITICAVCDGTIS